MSDTAPSRPGNLFWQLLYSLVTGITAIAGLLSLTGFFGSYAYLLNLTSHFRMQYTIALMASTLLLWSLGKRKTSLLALSLVLLNMIEIIPLYQKPDITAGNRRSGFSLLQVNVSSQNRQYEKLIGEIGRLKPDIVVMEEVTREWYQALTPVREEYPYVIETLDRSSLAVMVMSKLPLRETELIDFNDGRLPSLVTELQFKSQPIVLIATHPLSPRSKENFKLRNQQLYAIAQAFHKRDHPLMMVGDLNITSFSPIFNNFIDQINLYDSRQGFGIQPTWPARAWRVARITLDHCLLSAELSVKQRKLGNYVGSDHLPVFVEIEIETGNTAND